MSLNLNRIIQESLSNLDTNSTNDMVLAENDSNYELENDYEMDPFQAVYYELSSVAYNSAIASGLGALTLRNKIRSL